LASVLCSQSSIRKVYRSSSNNRRDAKSNNRSSARLSIEPYSELANPNLKISLEDGCFVLDVQCDGRKNLLVSQSKKLLYDTVMRALDCGDNKMYVIHGKTSPGNGKRRPWRQLLRKVFGNKCQTWNKNKAVSVIYLGKIEDCNLSIIAS